MELCFSSCVSRQSSGGEPNEINCRRILCFWRHKHINYSSHLCPPQLSLWSLLSIPFPLNSQPAFPHHCQRPSVLFFRQRNQREHKQNTQPWALPAVFYKWSFIYVNETCKYCGVGLFACWNMTHRSVCTLSSSHYKAVLWKHICNISHTSAD